VSCGDGVVCAHTIEVDRSNNTTKQLMDDGKSFDLLIENASHSFRKISNGDTVAQPVGDGSSV
jgi:hypothetical protein